MADVYGEIVYFVREKLHDMGFPIGKMDKAIEKMKLDIEHAEYEIFSEYVTPTAEEKAEEIIKDNWEMLEEIAGKKLKKVV